jgi:hypothetical protein
MLAQENDYIMSAAKSMYSSVTDPRILKLCTRRQEEIDGYNHRLERLAELEKSDAEQKAQIAALTADNLALKQELAEIKTLLKE